MNLSYLTDARIIKIGINNSMFWLRGNNLHLLFKSNYFLLYGGNTSAYYKPCVLKERASNFKTIELIALPQA
jgi:hypothetical protein